MKRFGAFFLSLTLLGLLGCASGGTAFTGTVQLVGQQMFTGGSANELLTNPDARFRYLRLDVKDRSPAMLVLAFVDAHPMGEIEVWYSAQNEVLKLQNGRVVGTQGFAVDWPKVRFTVGVPDWGDIAAVGADFERERDEVPTYRFGVKERLSLRAVDLPSSSVLPSSFSSDVARAYACFRETATSLDGATMTAWYAVDTRMEGKVVVFSEQCLKPDYCFRLQRWPPDKRVP